MLEIRDRLIFNFYSGLPQIVLHCVWERSSSSDSVCSHNSLSSVLCLCREQLTLYFPVLQEDNSIISLTRKLVARYCSLGFFKQTTIQWTVVFRAGQFQLRLLSTFLPVNNNVDTEFYNYILLLSTSLAVVSSPDPTLSRGETVW